MKRVLDDDPIRRYMHYVGSDEYVDEFNGAQMLLQRRGKLVSSYLDLNEKHIKTPLSDDEVPRYALNHPCDLLDAIRHNDNNIYLYEALIAAWSIDAVLKLFKTQFMKIVSKDLQDITFEQLYDNPKHKGKLQDYFSLSNNNEHLVAFAIPYYIKHGSDGVVKRFVDALYVSGYLLSFSEDAALTTKMKDLGVGLCFIQFEARYSREVFDFSSYLFHVSPSRYFEKICRRGLVPSAKNMTYKYPERIYLFNQTSLSFAKDFGVVKSIDMLKRHTSQQQWVNDNTFVVFSINSKKLLNHPLFKSKKMVFYIDPCYDGNIGGIQACEAIYTYSNIPFDLLEDKCFVYEVNSNKISSKLKSIMSFH